MAVEVEDAEVLDAFEVFGDGVEGMLVGRPDGVEVAGSALKFSVADPVPAVGAPILAARAKPRSKSPRLTCTLPGLSMAAVSAACMLAVSNTAFSAGTFHSIGILSRAVLAWCQCSAMTATPPL